MKALVARNPLGGGHNEVQTISSRPFGTVQSVQGVGLVDASKLKRSFAKV